MIFVEQAWDSITHLTNESIVEAMPQAQNIAHRVAEGKTEAAMLGLHSAKT